MKTQMVILIAFTFAVVGGVALRPCSGQAQDAAAATPAVTYSNAAFDPSLTKLPANYNGNDPAAIYNALLGKFGKSKGEFETTADYNARLEQEKKTPLLDALTLQSQLAFRLDKTQVGPQYDADKKQMMFSFRVNNRMNDAQDETAFILTDKVTSLGIEQGQNAFGTQFAVEKMREEGMQLYVVNPIEFLVDKKIVFSTQASDPDTFTVVPLEDTFRPRDTITVAIPMDVPTAVSAKGSMALLAVCQLSDKPSDKVNGGLPYVGQSVFDLPATVNLPRAVDVKSSFLLAKVNEFLIYNVVTGDIYNTIKQTPSK